MSQTLRTRGTISSTQLDNTQVTFFAKVRAGLPPHLSLVDEIAELLHVSNDSAYRRIRGEKQLTLDETALLAARFQVSLDQLFGVSDHVVLFSGKYIRPETFHFSSYLEQMYRIFKFICSHDDREIFYLTKDYPIYHYFMFPEIAAFKYYFWMRTYFSFPEMTGRKFDIGMFADELGKTGPAIASLYTQVPSTELLNPDNILTTLRQLEYCKEMRLFGSESDLDVLYDCMYRMADHMESQARLGLKYLYGQQPVSASAAYQLYINDFYTGDNMHLVRINGVYQCFLVHSGINHLQCMDEAFCRHTGAFIGQMMKRSVLISNTGEKERTKFFQEIRKRITMYKESKVNTLANF